MKVRLTIVAVTGVCIPAIAAVSASDITPESLSQGDVAYVLSVCLLVLTGAVVSLFWTLVKTMNKHGREWIRRDELDREDRKRYNDTLNDIISKCGR